MIIVWIMSKLQFNLYSSIKPLQHGLIREFYFNINPQTTLFISTRVSLDMNN